MRVVTELCVVRTFGGVDFSLVFIRVQFVSEFLWDRLRASIQFPVMPKRAQYVRFSGECAIRTKTTVCAPVAGRQRRGAVAVAPRPGSGASGGS
eukprot:COSAG02_NODE_962_length_15608_cov_16.347692_8_plen_94_part_00